jgi:magnesium chelatase family protein
LLDRIDLQVDVNRVPWRELSVEGRAEPSEAVRDRVAAARDRAARRSSHVNAELPDGELDGACRLDAAGRDVLGKIAEQRRLSARACRRVVRVARTVADLEGRDRIESRHVLEAARFRSLDRTKERPRTTHDD